MARFRVSFKSGRKGKKSRRTRRARKARVPVRAVRRAVRQAVAANVETKVRSVANLGQTLRSSISNVFDTQNIISLGCQVGAIEINQGAGQGQRIGNKITIKKLVFKGTIVPYGYNATTNTFCIPLQIKMFIFYDREDPNALPTPQLQANFLDFNNSVQALHNDLVDLWAPVNAERYRVLKTKTFKLGFASNDLAVLGTNGPNNWANNEFKLNCNFSMDITKYMVKKQSFVDNTANASNRQLYAMFVLCNSNGSPLADNQQPCGLQYQLTCWYKDA